jgi:hypothetical protein
MNRPIKHRLGGLLNHTAIPSSLLNKVAAITNPQASSDGSCGGDQSGRTVAGSFGVRDQKSGEPPGLVDWRESHRPSGLATVVRHPIAAACSVSSSIEGERYLLFSWAAAFDSLDAGIPVYR